MSDLPPKRTFLTALSMFVSWKRQTLGPRSSQHVGTAGDIEDDARDPTRIV
jgi:hypothetical protein